MTLPRELRENSSGNKEKYFYFGLKFGMLIAKKLTHITQHLMIGIVLSCEKFKCGNERHYEHNLSITIIGSIKKRPEVFDGRRAREVDFIVFACTESI